MLKRFSARIAALLVCAGKVGPVVLRDTAGLGAVGLISYGSWLVYEPAGFIVAGVMLLAGSLLTARS